MLFFFVTVLGFRLQTSNCLTAPDPCLSNDPVPRVAYRGGKCTYKALKPVCDRDLPPAWYRANTTTTDILIQIKPATLLSCGTKFPYWMNGSLPSSADGEVSRKACMTTISNECVKTKTIKVKNCGTFYVYYLPATDSCPEGYCFGPNDVCPPFDPCDIYEHTDVTFDKGETCNQCGPMISSSWYRFSGGVDVVSLFKQSSSNCSSGEHIWIKGSPSVVSNGISNITLCVSDTHSNCSEVHHVYSKQCTGFKVYKVPTVLSRTCKKLCIDTTGTNNKWYICKSENDAPHQLGGNLWIILALSIVVTVVKQHIR